ncbi:MAG: HU family DNA-binding protein [Azoarcus sp.]|jgi:DNA-binding protein HU-beta|nr:HU family DNA-binding protein [Azoarcus sp.]
MNRSELIDEIAERAEISKATADRVLCAVTDTVAKALRHGESVTLIGFGTFYVSERAERNGLNPRTGKAIRIAAANVPKFRAGKGLRETIK